MRVRLSGGAYTARSIIASAQRQVNLFAEAGPPNAVLDLGERRSSALAALYPTPGLRTLGEVLGPTGFSADFLPADFASTVTTRTFGNARGLYWANSGVLFYAAGSTLYWVQSDWTVTALGSIGAGSTPVSMADNGLTMVLVDGTTNGYQVDLATLAFSAISAATNGPDPTFVYGFSGADRVTAMDGYLLFNQPDTRNFFATYNGAVTFDSLWIAAKNGYSDKLMTVAVNQRSIWLIGQRTTEIWYNAGAADFPFAIVPGPFIAHGTNAKFSVARVLESLLWLSQDQSGGCILVRTKGYDAVPVSTRAIEAEWSGYATTDDAAGSAFQQNGHDFYQITFPTADKTWRLDLSTGEWHEAVWSDTNGAEHRHRAGAIAFAYGINVAADWETGQLYALDPTVFDDAGAPMVHRRGFPHILSDMNRVFYRQLILDMQTGTSVGTTTDGSGSTVGFSDDFTSDFAAVFVSDSAPLVLLRWSDDRGRTWGNPISASLGATGDYLSVVQFQRLGMARDRVFEVYWDAPVDTVLQGGFLLLEKADT